MSEKKRFPSVSDTCEEGPYGISPSLADQLRESFWDTGEPADILAEVKKATGRRIDIGAGIVLSASCLSSLVDKTPTLASGWADTFILTRTAHAGPSCDTQKGFKYLCIHKKPDGTYVLGRHEKGSCPYVDYDAEEENIPLDERVGTEE